MGAPRPQKGGPQKALILLLLLLLLVLLLLLLLSPLLSLSLRPLCRHPLWLYHQSKDLSCEREAAAGLKQQQSQAHEETERQRPGREEMLSPDLTETLLLLSCKETEWRLHLPPQ